MPNSQLDRDFENLKLLAARAVTETEDVLSGQPNSVRNAYRGHIANAMITLIAQAYLQDRERYAAPDPVIPPTPVPQPKI